MAPIPEGATLVDFSDNKVPDLEGAVFPATLKDLFLINCGMTSLKGGSLPEGLRYFDFERNRVDSEGII